MCKMAGALSILLILDGVLAAGQCRLTLPKHTPAVGPGASEARRGDVMTTV